FGALGIGGVAAFVFGSIILMDADVPGFGLPIGLITSVSTAAALLLPGVVWLAMRSRTRPVVSGAQQMTGEAAVAPADLDGDGSGAQGRARPRQASHGLAARRRARRRGRARRAAARAAVTLTRAVRRPVHKGATKERACQD